MTNSWARYGRRLLAAIVVVSAISAAPVFAAAYDPTPEPSAADAPVPLPPAPVPTAATKFSGYTPTAAPESGTSSGPAGEAAKTSASTDGVKSAVRTTVKPRRMRKMPKPKLQTRRLSTAGKRTVVRTRGGVGELQRARAILAGYVSRYPILKGATVSIGATPGGHQAVCFYQSGRIVINPNHRASLQSLIFHEIGHIIDWRDNGRIDWGESLSGRY